MKEFIKKLGSFFLDIIQVIVLALSIFVISYLFLFQPHQVRGNSMYANFYDQEFLLTDKISYRFGEPQRGDVVIFKAPPSEPCAETECEYIKRIIGLPGETVEIREGKVIISNENGSQVLNESDYLSGIPTPGEIQVTLGENEYFVLGDNRPASSDSRRWGSVPRDDIIGRVFIRAWPLVALAKFGAPAY